MRPNLPTVVHRRFKILAKATAYNERLLHINEKDCITLSKKIHPIKKKKKKWHLTRNKVLLYKYCIKLNKRLH